MSFSKQNSVIQNQLNTALHGAIVFQIDIFRSLKKPLIQGKLHITT